jgi:hypothetical protein
LDAANAIIKIKGYEHADVIKRLIERRPGPFQRDLLQFFDEAVKYKMEGYDFKVNFSEAVYGYGRMVTSPEVLFIEKGDKLSDKAALAKVNPAENGGIDLNQINVLRKGKTVNVQFDPAQLNELMQGGFEGFTPVIINITHISSPFQLLGINPAKQPETLAKV